MRRTLIVILAFIACSLVVAYTAWRVAWPLWLKSREPVQVSAPWPVASDAENHIALESETPIIGTTFTLRARFSSATPRSVASIWLSKPVDGRPVIVHSQGAGFLESKNQQFSFSADVLIRDNWLPDTYDLEIRFGAESVATRKVQIIARPPHIPRSKKPNDQEARDLAIVAPATVEEAVQAVHQGITDKHWPNIEKACRGVKMIHADAEVVRSLMPLLASDADDTTRGLVFRALFHIGPAAEPAVPTLIESLENRKLRDPACLALGSIGPAAAPAVPRLVQMLKEGDKTGLGALGRIGPGAEEAVPVIIELVRAPESDVNYVRSGPKAALGGIGAPAASALSTTLSDPDPGVRRRAAIVLEHMGPTATPAVPALIASLHDTSTRDWAAAALGRIGPLAEAAVPALAELLESDEFTVRVCAARSLGEIGAASKPTLPTLKRRVHDPERRVRVAADEAIQRIEKQEASASK